MVGVDMSQGNRASKDTVEKVLRLEASTGFLDSAATCGLEAFIDQHLPEAGPVVIGYRTADRATREGMIEALFTFLGDGEHALPRTDRLDRPITALQGVGEKRAAALRSLGILTVEDLLLYFPRRLEDRSTSVEIGRLRLGQEAAVRGEVLAVDRRRVGRGMTIVKAALGDGSGFLYAVWFNQPWLADQLRRGVVIDVFGKAERSHGELQMRSPVWELADAGL